MPPHFRDEFPVPSELCNSTDIYILTLALSLRIVFQDDNSPAQREKMVCAALPGSAIVSNVRGENQQKNCWLTRWLTI